jgi:hypothetical protein
LKWKEKWKNFSAPNFENSSNGKKEENLIQKIRKSKKLNFISKFSSENYGN